MDPLLLELIKQLPTLVKLVRSDTREIRKTQKEIVQRLGRVEGKLDGQLLHEARTAFDRLEAGLSADTAATRDAELSAARTGFARVMNLIPEGEVLIGSGTVRNLDLVCAGYWGSFVYFVVRDDWSNAALCVYRCTLLSKDFGLQFFPSNMFSKDYRHILETAERRANELQAQLEVVHRRNVLSVSGYVAAQTARGAATAAIVGVGAVASAATAPTGNFNVAPLALAIRGGLKLFESVGPSPLTLADEETLKERIEASLREGERVTNELLEECNSRVTALTAISARVLSNAPEIVSKRGQQLRD